MEKTICIKDMVDTGALYKGFTWEHAVNDAVKRFNAPIKPVFIDLNPDLPLADDREFSHYEMQIKDKGRLFKTRIPAALNAYVADILDQGTRELNG